MNIRTVLYTLMNERRCKVGKWRRRKKETNEAHKRRKKTNTNKTQIEKRRN